MLAHTLQASFAGTPETVARGLADFAARHGADELMVSAGIHDPAARIRSYELTAAAFADLAGARSAA